MPAPAEVVPHPPNGGIVDPASWQAAAVVTRSYELFARLCAHPGVPHLLRGDPRFAAVLDESTRRAMRAIHAGAPVRGQFDAAAAIDGATAAVLLLDRIAGGPLEVQVGGLVRSLIPTAAGRVLNVTGWAGGAPLTTTQVAARDGTGRETVARVRRQILQRLPRRPWLPALDAPARY